MNKNIFKFFIFIISLAVFSVLFFVFVYNSKQTENYETVTISFGENAEIKAFVSDNIQKRVKGLSGIKELDEDRGMFFIFDYPDFHGIWMKDMNFPIDIIFLDENYTVLNIYQDTKPETFPKTFYSTKKSLYVLEVNAGFAESSKIKIGDKLGIKK